MGRTIRLLTPSEQTVGAAALREALARAGHGADFVVEAGRDEAWARIALSHHNGPEIATIDRSVVSCESTGRG